MHLCFRCVQPQMCLACSTCIQLHGLGAHGYLARYHLQLIHTHVTVLLRRFLSPSGRSGIVRESFGGHFGSFGGRSGIVRGSFWCRWGSFGAVPGSFGGRSGLVRRSFGSRSGFVRKFFEKNFEKIFERCNLPKDVIFSNTPLNIWVADMGASVAATAVLTTKSDSGWPLSG